MSYQPVIVKEDDADVYEQLEKRVSGMGLDPYANRKESNRQHAAKFEKFGLCKDCAYFRYAASEFRIHSAFCKEFVIRLHDNDPIRECTSYDCKTAMSLFTMSQIATMIDPPARKAGFITEEKED